MRGFPLVIIASFLLLMTACNHNKLTGNLEIDHRVKQIIFFSNESNYQVEAPYYDAIIELKQQFPEEVKNMMTLSPTNAKEHFATYDVTDCPTIIVIFNDKIMVKVDGESTKEQIIKPIADALSNNL